MALTISIVTACYNTTPFLERIYRSLRAQTFSNFEWICVDDCSTDATIDELLKLDAPGELGMKVFRLPVNSGGSVALALGMQKATGECIVSLDHDDELLPHALATIAEEWPTIADQEEVCGLFYQVSMNGNLVGRRLEPGMRLRQTELNHRFPDVHDGTFALKAARAAEVHRPERAEPTVTSAVQLSELTRNQVYVVGRNAPVRNYHRDNPNSQSNAVRLSRKTVWSFARLLDLADRHALHSPVRLVRHAIALARFSRLIHGSYMAGARHIGRPGMRAFLRLSVLPAWLVDQAKGPPRANVVASEPYPLHLLDQVEDLKAASRAA